MDNKGIFHNKEVIYKTVLRIATYFILVIISAVFFNSKGPVILTFFGSFVLVVSLLHIGIKPKSFQNISKLPKTRTIVSHWGPLIMYHSHHSAEARIKGKEFRIGHKYFCTGCYGGLLGTIISIFLMGSYLVYGCNQDLAIIMVLSLPVWFIPIIFRYTLIINMKNIPRLLCNMLLPVGCSILLILTDFTFQNWALNGITISLIICVAYLRKYASDREEKKIGY